MILQYWRPLFHIVNGTFSWSLSSLFIRSRSAANFHICLQFFFFVIYISKVIFYVLSTINFFWYCIISFGVISYICVYLLSPLFPLSISLFRIFLLIFFSCLLWLSFCISCCFFVLSCSSSAHLSFSLSIFVFSIFSFFVLFFLFVFSALFSWFFFILLRFYLFPLLYLYPHLFFLFYLYYVIYFLTKLLVLKNKRGISE